MGTDIHAFVEYSLDRDLQPGPGHESDPALCLARFFLSRDYELFDALGEGRSSLLEEVDRISSLIRPRGIPSDMSKTVALSYYDLIIDDASPSEYFWNPSSCVRRVDAEARVQSGKAHFGLVSQTIWYGGTSPRVWQAVSQEGWRAPSWLNVSEIEQSLSHRSIPLDRTPIDFQSMLDCMKALESRVGLNRVRLVVWFDT